MLYVPEAVGPHGRGRVVARPMVLLTMFRKVMMEKSILDPDAMWWKVRDLDTGNDIEDVIRADDGSGIYEQYVRDESGLLVRDESGAVATVVKQGRIKVYDSRIGFSTDN